MTLRKNHIRWLQLGIVIIFLSGWEVAGRSSAKLSFLLGTPTAVWREFWQLAIHEQLWLHFTVTSWEAVAGLLMGTVVGTAGGLALWYSKTLATVARPFVVALGTLPVFAFAPLMIVWFGVGLGMKIALATFSTVFVAFSQGYKGATSIGTDLIDSLRSMKASKNQIFFKVIVPGSIDWVLSSMRLNVGFSLLGALIGEFIASDRGLGHLIVRSSSLYNTPRALAAAIGITVLALLFDWFARYVERNSHRLVQWLSVPKVLWKTGPPLSR